MSDEVITVVVAIGIMAITFSLAVAIDAVALRRGADHADAPSKPLADVLIDRAKAAYAKDRITDDQLAMAVERVLTQGMEFGELERLIRDWEGANNAQPMPLGVDEFDLPSGWWLRPDGQAVEIRGALT